MSSTLITKEPKYETKKVRKFEIGQSKIEYTFKSAFSGLRQFVGTESPAL